MEYYGLGILFLCYVFYFVFLRKRVNTWFDARYLRSILNKLPHCGNIKFNDKGLRSLREQVYSYSHRLTEDECTFVLNMDLDMFAKLGKRI
jgi:hypothetical protein